MRKKLNILLISHNFWPENFPINAIIKNLSNKVNFTIITGKPNYPTGDIYKGYKKFGVQIENFNKSHKIIRVPILPRKKGTSIQLFFNYISFLLSGIIFGYFYTKHLQFDRIFVYSPSPATQIGIGIFFKKIKKIKLIVWVQDIWPDSLYSTGHLKKNFFHKYLKYIFHSLYKKSDLLLLQSEFFKKYFIQHKISNNLVVVPNPADDSFNDTKNNINNILLDKNFFNITYTGNIGTAQPFENFCSVANKIYSKNKKIVFNIFGEGKNKNKLIDDIAKYKNKNIKIFDYVDRSQLAHIYKSSDVLLILLKNKKIFNITIPSKFQNYLVHKKPILGWIAGQTAKIINEYKCGIVAFPNNKVQFENSVLKLFKLNKINKLDKFGNNSYKLYKNNFTNKIISNLIFKSLDKC